ncbi:MAG: efflux RND transporter permease subunit [Gammaproteobacteria bacterium]|nr:efflux RND transporter permease subunit [Gammaproteobacteria bacterium]
MHYIDAAVSRSRTTISVFVVVLLIGLASYNSIPIEMNPDVSVPLVVTTIIHEGISPEDAERLLAKPAEVELKAVDGVTEITSVSSEGAATIVTEFDINIDAGQALIEIREAINRAQARFPQSTEEPIIQEVSAAAIPIVQIAIGGDNVPERALLKVAQDLQREIETLPEILSVDMVGNREELLEATIDPGQLETYGITNTQIVRAVTSNNRLIPAGSVDTGRGSFSIKVPGLIETREDLFDLPIASTESGVITIRDIAEVKRTFKDATRYSYANSAPSISLNISKRTGENLIEAMDKIELIVEEMIPSLPPAVTISFMNNSATIALEQTMGLQGNMATAMVLVFIVVIATVGIRSSILVTLAVPFSFFFAFIVISMLGFTYNFMVIFGLLLGLGMLIDGAIVMVEFADRKMTEGMDSRTAYRAAVQRMFWPIMASTATTLAAFLPLMFWPGVPGEFMRYLPITVFAVLVGSLIYALLFAPTLGALFGRRPADLDSEYLQELEEGDPQKVGGITGLYARILKSAVKRPLTVMLLAIVTMGTIVSAYMNFGKGIEFFVKSEPLMTQVKVFARGNFSPSEIAEIMLDVEARIVEIGHYKNIVTQSGAGGLRLQPGPGGDAALDLVGSILIELTERRGRELNGFELENMYRDAISDLPGLKAEVVTIEQGPPVGKEIQVELSGDDLDLLAAEGKRIRDHMTNNMTGLIDIDDTMPIPGIEWEIQVDRARAAMMGANITEIGTAIQLMTNGVFMGDYRPDDTEEEVDIRIRYPVEYRGLEQIDTIRISTPNGPVPISSFITRVAKPKVGSIKRIDGQRVVYVRANPAPGIVASNKLNELQRYMDENPVVAGVKFQFRGANEEQAESIAFLSRAFLLALAIMAILLVTQFNSYYQALLILSSVIMSTSGVLLGLLITGNTFSVMLTGIGIVALAGIIVNNNIVLIDTYNYLRKTHHEWSLTEIIVHTGVQRLRPVFLTTFTTGFGLLPLAMGISVDLIAPEIEVGGPIASQWAGLARTIVFGLSFGTILTLIVTPAMLALPSSVRNMFKRNKGKPIDNLIGQTTATAS